MDSVVVDSMSTMQEAASKNACNENLKGKVDEIRNAGKKSDKKKSTSLTSTS